MGDLSSGERLQTQRERNLSGLRPRMLTVSMSRNRLFLGRLLSSRARLCFTGQIDFHPGIGKL
jgi:hypothetical protein